MTSLLHRFLDASVIASCDRTGFARHQARFADSPTRDLTGRTVLITGGTAGIGLAAAQGIAACGATVKLWARDPKRGERAGQLLGQPDAFQSVDLGDLDAVADAAHAVPSVPLAGVVLCAGAMPLERTLTEEGHELVWASQVLGHTLLLQILKARGVLTAETRVVWVSSGGMYTSRIDLSDLKREQRYQRHAVYAHAKRAQVVLCEQLAVQWPNVPMASMHPGWVDTEAVAHSMPWFHRLFRPILRTPEQGADTIVWLVTVAQTWASGRFWFDRRAQRRPLGRLTPEMKRERAELLRTVMNATDWVNR